jgi:signal transduction histidine kinase
MSERGLDVRLEAGDEVKVLADEALLHRMIANLLDNELKHLPRGCCVTIKLQAEEDAAALTLEDNGPGFDPEVLEQVFARRVKGRDSDGHGLGLAFVDAVVRAHGGTVTARNHEGGGAQIAVTLPLASPHQVQQARTPTERQSSAA